VAPRLEHPRPPAHTRRPSATAGARPRRPSLPAPARPTSRDRSLNRPNAAPVAAPLRDRGIGLLAAFTFAMLVMVALAVLVGAIGSWWILIPVMAVDFAVTAAVLVMMARLLNDGRGG
jgi:hypothetical protein